MKVETLNMDAIDLQDDGSRYVSELLLENVSICRLVSMEMDKWEEINIIDFIQELNNFIGVISLTTDTHSVQEQRYGYRIWI